jgi:hypothetical protein
LYYDRKDTTLLLIGNDSEDGVEEIGKLNANVAPLALFAPHIHPS